MSCSSLCIEAALELNENLSVFFSSFYFLLSRPDYNSSRVRLDLKTFFDSAWRSGFSNKIVLLFILLLEPATGRARKWTVYQMKPKQSCRPLGFLLRSPPPSPPPSPAPALPPPAAAPNSSRLCCYPVLHMKLITKQRLGTLAEKPRAKRDFRKGRPPNSGRLMRNDAQVSGALASVWDAL